MFVTNDNLLETLLFGSDTIYKMYYNLLQNIYPRFRSFLVFLFEAKSFP